MLFSRLNLEWGQSGASDQLTGGTCKLERRVRGQRPWLTFRQMGGSWNWYLGGNQRRGAKAGVSQEMNDNLFGSTRCLADLILWKNWGSQRGPSLVGGSKSRSCRHTEEHFWINQLSQASSAPFMVLSSYLLLNIFLFYLTSCLNVEFCSVCVEFYELCYMRGSISAGCC